MAIAKYSLTTVDCPDPLALAGFYAQLTGFQVRPYNSNWCELLREGVAVIGFQRIEHFVAPTWPVGPVPQQVHLHFDVADLDVAEADVIAIGGQAAENQTGTEFRVYFDPIGHPFCLVLNSELENFLDPLISEVTASRI